VTTEADRLLSLEKRVGEVEGRLTAVDATLVPIIEGVGNFRQFQRRGYEFFDKFEARAEAEKEAELAAEKVVQAAEKKAAEAAAVKAEERRAAMTKKFAVLSILAALLATPAFYAGKNVYDFASTLLTIVQEWHEVHKGELPPRKGFFSPDAPVIAGAKQDPQSAGAELPSR